MKVLFTADLHIKVGQKNVPRDWQKNRYIKLFNLITDIECDLLVLGGDIFDKVPNMEELELYFELISKIKYKTIVFDGNHEATRKGRTFLHNLSKATTALNSKVEVISSPMSIDTMDFIPYTHLKKFKPDDYTGNILFTHVRGNIPPHVKAEIDLTKLKRWETVYAGDLHSHSNSQLNIVYPGSPLSTSFHRKSITSGVLLIESKSNTYEWIELDVPQLIRKTVDSEKDIITTYPDHTIYELVGDVAELSSVADSSLLDKKIANKNSEATLNLNNISIEGELALYLENVQKIPTDKVDEIIKVHNDYIGET